MKTLPLTIAVAQLKGGCGKTTIATHIAARSARTGLATWLLDLDRQRSALDWVARRPAELPPITALAADAEELHLPSGAGITVIDVPAGLRRKALHEVIRVADVVVVPVQPSAFDESATRVFLDQLQELKPVRKGRRPVAVVGNRVDPRTAAGRRLDTFLAELSFPAVARLPSSQLYVTAAETGVTVFDLPRGVAGRLLPAWDPLWTFIHESTP